MKDQPVRVLYMMLQSQVGWRRIGPFPQGLALIEEDRELSKGYSQNTLHPPKMQVKRTVAELCCKERIHPDALHAGAL